MQTTHSGIQYQGNSWKDAGWIQGVGEMTGNGASSEQTSRSQAAALSSLQMNPRPNTEPQSS